LVEQSHEQNRDVVSRLREARDAQRKATEAVPFDEQAIRSTTQALVEAETNAAIARAKLHAEIFALLTPEQQAQAAKLKTEREARQSQRGPRGARGSAGV